MALPDGLNTPFFEKVAFYLDTLEQFIDFDEMKKLFLQQAETNATANLTENYAPMELVKAALEDIRAMEDWEYWNYIIANTMVFWLLKKNIGPNVSDQAFHYCHQMMYGFDIVRRVKAAQNGEETKPLFTQDDLES